MAQLADKIDYSEGSIKSHLIEFLDKDLVESLNSDGVSPPYRGTSEAKKLLEPIFFIRKIGFIFTVFVFAVFLMLFGWYIYHPTLLIYVWLPLTMAGFCLLIFVLILYPDLLLKIGKIAFPSSG